MRKPFGFRFFALAQIKRYPKSYLPPFINLKNRGHILRKSSAAKMRAFPLSKAPALCFALTSIFSLINRNLHWERIKAI